MSFTRLNPKPTRYSATYAVPALSAGASGYWNIPIATEGTPIAVCAFTSQISASNGLMMTPVAFTNERVYVNYYAPKAINANTVTLTIYATTV